MVATEMVATQMMAMEGGINHLRKMNVFPILIAKMMAIHAQTKFAGMANAKIFPIAIHAMTAMPAQREINAPMAIA